MPAHPSWLSPARGSLAPPAATRNPRPAAAKPPTPPRNHTPTRNTSPPSTPPTNQHPGGNHSARTVRRKNEIAAQAAAWSQLVDVEALADRLVEQAADPAAAAILRPLLPGMIVAMVQGATTPGPSGAADRAALAKLIGAPWASTSADRKGGQTGKTREQGKAIGGRLEAALAAKERALRAGSDTDDDAEGAEAPETLDFEE